jgi:hypothetical protein
MPDRNHPPRGAIHDLATLLALGYLRHIRAARCSAEKGSARAPKGLDDVAPRAKVALGPVGPRNGGTNDGR